MSNKSVEQWTLGVAASDQLRAALGGRALAGDRAAYDQLASHFGHSLEQLRTHVDLEFGFGRSDSFQEEPPHNKVTPRATYRIYLSGLLSPGEIDTISDQTFTEAVARTFYHDASPQARIEEAWRKRHFIMSGGSALLGGDIAAASAFLGYEPGIYSGLTLGVVGVLGLAATGLHKRRWDQTMPDIPQHITPPVRIVQPN